MNPDNSFNYSDDRSFLQKYGFVVGVGSVVLLAGLIFAGRQLFSKHSEVHRMPEVTMVKLLPPPPQPTPPPIQKPPEPKMVEQKMIEQAPVDKDEQKPDEQPKADPVSTGIKGDGPDAFGLAGNGRGGQFGGNGNRGGKWGWYAAQVQGLVEDALRGNPKTRSADLRIVVRIWPDPNTGRITRAELSGSIGDPALESSIRDEILRGLQLREPPPKDMPLPIVLRLTARRPS